MNNVDKCTSLEYTILSKYNREVLLLKTSDLPAFLSHIAVNEDNIKKLLF